MARPLRIEFPGALYYVTSTGRNRRKVFLKPEDPVEWLDILQNVCRRYDWVVYCYCIMPDNYKFVVQTMQPTLSIGMRQLNGIYTQNFNERYSRGGNLFHGRFKSVHVQRDKYLAVLARYILDSPVRAGFVKYPYQYKWSSCRLLRESENTPEWIRLDWCDDDLVRELTDTEQYQATKEEGVLGNIRKQVYLGDQDFEKWVNEQKISDGSGKQKTTDKTDKELYDIDQYVNKYESRDEAISKAYYSGSYSMKEIGKYFSLHYSTISRIIKRYEQS